MPQIIQMWPKFPGTMKNAPTIPANTMRYFIPQNLINKMYKIKTLHNTVDITCG